MSGDETLLLLKAADGDAGALARRAVALLPEALAIAAILPAEALPALAHADGLAPGLPDVLLTLAGEADAGAAVAGLAGTIAVPASAVLGLRRHAILPGKDAVRLHFGLRRLERLTLADFQDYWLHRHAEFGRRLIPPYSYHQLHADPAATERLARATGLPASTLDGIAEVHFPEVAALIAQLSRPDVAEGALADERNFIDHARSEFWAYREWPGS